LGRTRPVVAIDGPAGSGKTTTAKLVAERLGFMHIDTGAMYRAVTLKVLRSGVDLADQEAIARLLESTRVGLEECDAEARVMLDGEDVTGQIRMPEVTRLVSRVSTLRPVREAMVREQRRMGREGGIVLEGRDIGTVVFPDAELKFFLSANLEERVRRRLAELNGQGVRASAEELRREIQERDRMDSTREESPLRRAPDAIELDTSRLSVEEQVRVVTDHVREMIKGRGQ
jgi:cytidylate kinase